jgi:hypothetical protein
MIVKIRLEIFTSPVLIISYYFSKVKKLYNAPIKFILKEGMKLDINT